MFKQCPTRSKHPFSSNLAYIDLTRNTQKRTHFVSFEFWTSFQFYSISDVENVGLFFPFSKSHCQSCPTVVRHSTEPDHPWAGHSRVFVCWSVWAPGFPTKRVPRPGRRGPCQPRGWAGSRASRRTPVHLREGLRWPFSPNSAFTSDEPLEGKAACWACCLSWRSAGGCSASAAQPPCTNRWGTGLGAELFKTA